MASAAPTAAAATAGAGAGAGAAAGTGGSTTTGNTVQIVGVTGDKSFSDLASAANGLAFIAGNLKVAVSEVADAAAVDKWAADNVPAFKGASGATIAVINGTQAKTAPDAIAFLREHYIGHGAKPRAVFHNNDVAAAGDADEYDFDVAIIGGGSGGMAAAKHMAEVFHANVVMFDFVKPSPYGTKWGLGGTCVNVGCIPKKLFHTAALLRGSLKDAKDYGYTDVSDTAFTWNALRDKVDDYIKSLNFSYRVEMRDNNVSYKNATAVFKDAHTLTTTDRRGREKDVSARRIIIAVGGRPTQLSIPGGELAITSDDIFQLDHAPGKTLVVGASYVALECAGFLTGLGFDTTVAVRSILLRGFDQQIAEMIGEHMKEEGTKFLRPVVPTKIEKADDGRLVVTFKSRTDGAESQDVFDTVVAAIGRTADTARLNLDKVGVEVAKNGKIISPADNEQSTVPHIYAIGDCLAGKPELTPVAIQAGKMLGDRLFGGSTLAMDYVNIPTTVFTPLEYGVTGLAEEDAEAKYGKDNIEVYHIKFVPLEWSITGHRHDQKGYVKIVCNKLDNERVLAMHYLGPNAGEVTQGFGSAIRGGATYKTIFDTVGIHPTTAEKFTTLTITKRSGKDIEAGGGC